MIPLSVFSLIIINGLGVLLLIIFIKNIERWFEGEPKLRDVFFNNSLKKHREDEI